MMRRFVSLVVLLVAGVLLTGIIVSAQDRVSAMANLLRVDIAAKKTRVLSDAMLLNSPEGAAFWPVYRQYERELAEFNDNRLALIKEYTQNYKSLDDAKAKELIEKSFELQERRLSLLRKYAGELQKSLPTKRVAMFIQVESQLLRLIDLQASVELPELR